MFSKANTWWYKASECCTCYRESVVDHCGTTEFKAIDCEQQRALCLTMVIQVVGLQRALYLPDGPDWGLFNIALWWPLSAAPSPFVTISAGVVGLNRGQECLVSETKEWLLLLDCVWQTTVTAASLPLCDPFPLCFNNLQLRQRSYRLHILVNDCVKCGRLDKSLGWHYAL